jgi:hypothetical protein
MCIAVYNTGRSTSILWLVRLDHGLRYSIGNLSRFWSLKAYMYMYMYMHDTRALTKEHVNDEDGAQAPHKRRFD